MSMANFKKKVTSKYRGVHWSEKRGKWRVEVRREKFIKFCDTELEAAMLYNAVAKRVWPGEYLNPTPVEEMGPFSIADFGRAFWLAPETHVYVDQFRTSETPVFYESLAKSEWFFLKGIACAANYDPDTRRFTFLEMHDLVFGGPCIHLNGNTLDNRRINLSAQSVTQDEAITILVA